MLLGRAAFGLFIDYGNVSHLQCIFNFFYFFFFIKAMQSLIFLINNFKVIKLKDMTENDYLT